MWNRNREENGSSERVSQEALLMEFFEEASLRRVEKRVPPDGSVSSRFAKHSLQTLPPTMNPA
jgi:hypothetical protein